MFATTVRLQDETAERLKAYASRAGAPTLNAALCALIATGLDVVERESEREGVPAIIAATPRQRGAR